MASKILKYIGAGLTSAFLSYTPLVYAAESETTDSIIPYRGVSALKLRELRRKRQAQKGTNIVENAREAKNKEQLEKQPERKAGVGLPESSIPVKPAYNVPVAPVEVVPLTPVEDEGIIRRAELLKQREKEERAQKEREKREKRAVGVPAAKSIIIPIKIDIDIPVDDSAKLINSNTVASAYSLGLEAVVGTDSQLEGILFGNNYFARAGVLIGDKTGFAARAGRLGDLVDLQASYENVDGNNAVIAGARTRFNSDWINSLSVNGYFGDVSGVDAKVSVPLYRTKNFDWNASLGFYTLKSEDNDCSGIDAGTKVAWQVSDNIALEGKLEYLSDDGLTGDNMRAHVGIRIGSRKIENMSIESYSLSSMIGSDALLEERTYSALMPASTPTGRNGGIKPGPGPGPTPNPAETDGTGSSDLR